MLSNFLKNEKAISEASDDTKRSIQHLDGNSQQFAQSPNSEDSIQEIMYTEDLIKTFYIPNI